MTWFVLIVMLSEPTIDYCLPERCRFERRCVKSTGSLTSKLVILGEAPGRVEVQQGVPFVGPAGRLLNELLSEAQLSRNDCFITNTVNCIDLSRDDKRPLPAELDACRPRLDAEIEVCNPRAILLVGNTAIQRYFPGERVGQIYNSVRAVSDHTVVIPTYHPAHVLRGNHQVRGVILEGIKIAKRFLS